MCRDGSGCSYEDPGQGWTCGIRVEYDAGTTIKGRKRPRTVATEGCPIATDEHPAEERVGTGHRVSFRGRWRAHSSHMLGATCRMPVSSSPGCTEPNILK